MGVFLSVLAAATVFAIAVAHLIWGLRIWWPITDERLLVRTIAGFRNVEKMPPPFACFIVAGAMCVMCIVALSLGGLISIVPTKISFYLGVATSAIFIGRGTLGFTKYWAGITPEHPFRELDRKYYSPLCLALGISYLVLAFGQ